MEALYVMLPFLAALIVLVALPSSRRPGGSSAEVLHHQVEPVRTGASGGWRDLRPRR